jgi:4-amino-4-deoxy-L-arabinose transferase-like glycosyltransferase
MRRAAAYLPIGAILVLAAALRTFRISENGFGREYYAAAVRGMIENWQNAFFNSFDPGGFVTLDKPPLAIWMQALSAKLLGFSEFAVLLPQVIEGLAAVLLVYLIMARAFERRAALLAALFLALAPGSVAIDRSNNTDSLLIVVLLFAAWLAMRAAESGRLRYLVGAMALIGIGFNVKMAAALIFAPTIALVYFAFNRQISLPRHVLHQAAAGVLLVAVALSWVTAFDLTPPDRRPYAGSTKNNSMLELVLKHNGADRFTHFEPVSTNNEPRPMLYDESPTGPYRMFRPLQAGQAAWLLPLALAGILFGFFAREKIRERRIAIAIWSGWFASYWIVFSAAGGPFHTYYLAALAPPIAALAGIGVSEAWSRYRNGEARRLLIPALIALTMLWQAWIAYGQAGASAPPWLLVTALAAALFAVLAAILFLTDIPRRHPALGTLPLVALLALPAAAALSVVLIRPNVAAPVATLGAYGEKETFDVTRANPRRRDFARNKMVAFLKERHGSEKFLVAVENAFLAAPIIIASGDAVMTLGGYLGTDPILTPETLAERALRGEVRFVLVGGFSLTKRNQPNEIALREWVQKNATRVDPALWSIAPQNAGKVFRVRLGGVLTEMTYPELYDLRAKSAQ